MGGSTGRSAGTTNRFAILYRIGAVKKPETRGRKIASFVADLERGDTPYPRKQP